MGNIDNLGDYAHPRGGYARGGSRRRTSIKVKQSKSKPDLGPDNTVFGPKKDRFATRKNPFGPAQFEMDPMNGAMEQDYNEPLNPYQKSNKKKYLFGQ